MVWMVIPCTSCCSCRAGPQGSAVVLWQQHENSWDPAAFPCGLCRIIQLFLEALLQQLPGMSRLPHKFPAEHLILHSKVHLLLAKSCPQTHSPQGLCQPLPPSHTISIQVDQDRCNQIARTLQGILSCACSVHPQPKYTWQIPDRQC